MENTQISRRKVVAGAAWAAPVVAASAAVPAFAASSTCTDLNTKGTATNNSTMSSNASVEETVTMTKDTDFVFTIVGGAGGGSSSNYIGGAGASVTGTLHLSKGDVVRIVTASGGVSFTDPGQGNGSGKATLANASGATEGGRGYGNGGDNADLSTVSLPSVIGNSDNLSAVYSYQLYPIATPRYGGTGGGASAIYVNGVLKAVAGGGGGAGAMWTANLAKPADSNVPYFSTTIKERSRGGDAGTDGATASSNAKLIAKNETTQAELASTYALVTGGSSASGSTAGAGGTATSAVGGARTTANFKNYQNVDADGVAGSGANGGGGSYGYAYGFQATNGSKNPTNSGLEGSSDSDWQGAVVYTPGTGGGGYAGGGSGAAIGLAYTTGDSTTRTYNGKTVTNYYGAIGAAVSGGGAGSSFTADDVDDVTIKSSGVNNTTAQTRVNGSASYSYCS